MNRHASSAEPGLLSLLVAVFDGTRELAGATAACSGRAELFEPSWPSEHPDIRQYRREAALAVCAACPALPSCRRWITTEPRTRWHGWVVAGDEEHSMTIDHQSPAERADYPTSLSLGGGTDGA